MEISVLVMAAPINVLGIEKYTYLQGLSYSPAVVYTQRHSTPLQAFPLLSEKLLSMHVFILNS